MNDHSEFYKTLGGHILSVAEKNPDHNALWADSQLMNYRQLIDTSKSLAATILNSGIQKSNVAIYSYRSRWAYISMLGTLLAGKTYVPLNPKFPVIRNRQIAEQADTRIYFVDKRCEKQFSEWVDDIAEKAMIIFPDHPQVPQWCRKSPRHEYLCSKDLLPSSSWHPPENAGQHDYAYLLFTSGTTGKPKGIAVSHTNVMAYLSTLQDKWPLSPHDRCSQIYDQTFDVSVHDIFTCWQAGACLYVVPEIRLLCPADFVNQHQLTCWGSVPSLLDFIKKFKKLNPGAFPSLRYSFFCGEALPTDSAKAWADACPNSQIINLFGPTEATIAITACQWNRNHPPETPVMPIGHAFNGQETAIVDNENRPVPPGEKGRLFLAGSQVVSGYWNNREKTRQHFIHQRIPGKQSTRWYVTGDIASEEPEFGLHFHGREDFQIKVNGYRVELEEISRILRKNFPCSWAVAIPWPVDAITGRASGIVAWMSGRKEERIPEQTIKRFCSGNLPVYMLPSRVLWADELPRNGSGKIDIGALQHMTREILE